MPRSSRVTLHVIDLLVLFTNNRLYCDQREIWSRRNLKLPLELLELVEEILHGTSGGTSGTSKTCGPKNDPPK
jgi:hypothetical protein